MSSSIEVVDLPLQQPPQAYPYTQYADDVNVVAFFTAFNQLAQTYLDWFNNTPMGIYTNPNIGGSSIPNILDWIGMGLYGIPRPVFSTLNSQFYAAINDVEINLLPINSSQSVQAGQAVQANDDYYKRVLTWFLYRGDGPYFTTSVLRRKVARFLFGVNGTDITPDQAQQVGISYANFNTPATATILITIPGGIAASNFVSAFEQGLLPFPFMLNAGVIPQ